MQWKYMGKVRKSVSHGNSADRRILYLFQRTIKSWDWLSLGDCYQKKKKESNRALSSRLVNWLR